CVIIVSHDRYFMDKLVDHLFVFEGDGVVRDFPGNYSQYRIKEWEERKENVVQKTEPTELKKPEPAKNVSEKLSYKERREFESLESEIARLDQEKKSLEAKMSDGTMKYDDMQQAAARMGEILQAIEMKEMRWLELSERN
ncbi:MAG TPA: ABC transporter ATP-binding protein, partial [Chitinophagaceae bacterium]|nr:ABC transporter ATP-binding protein [Chitinophagaceae bacterium]